MKREHKWIEGLAQRALSGAKRLDAENARLRERVESLEPALRLLRERVKELESERDSYMKMADRGVAMVSELQERAEKAERELAELKPKLKEQYKRAFDAEIALEESETDLSNHRADERASIADALEAEADKDEAQLKRIKGKDATPAAFTHPAAHESIATRRDIVKRLRSGEGL